MPIAHPIRRALPALALAWSVTPVLADTSVMVQCADSTTFQAQPACSSLFQGQPPSMSTVTTSATASASPGVLKARADATGLMAVQSSANAIAEFSDTLLIEATEPGSAGTARVHFGAVLEHQSTRALGSFSGAGDLASTSVGLRLEAIGLTTAWSFMTYGLDSVAVRHVEPGVIETDHQVQPLAPFAFDVVLGQPFLVRAWLAVGAGVAGNAQATADAGHSFYWGGLLSLTDADGQAMGYTLSSASGTDWSQSFAPVPEAGTSALLLAGLALVLLAAARRGQADGHGTIPALPDLQAGPACKPCPHTPIRSPSTTSTSPCRPS